MSPTLPNTPFLAAPNDVMDRFVALLEYLFFSDREKDVPRPPDDSRFVHNPEEIVKNLKNLGWGADLEPAAEFQIVLEKGMDGKEPLVCLLRNQHPLTFTFRLYCQKHGSLIENWIESWVTEREFEELQVFVGKVIKSEMRLGQVKSRAEFIRVLGHLVAHDYSGMVWCDWTLTEEERALVMEMTNGKNMNIVEAPPTKKTVQPIEGGGIKVILLTTDKTTVELLAHRVELALCRAFGKGNHELIHLNSVQDTLPHLQRFGARMFLLGIQEPGEVQIATIKQQNPDIQLIALLDVLEDSYGNIVMLKEAGVDSVVGKLATINEMALVFRKSCKQQRRAISV